MLTSCYFHSLFGFFNQLDCFHALLKIVLGGHNKNTEKKKAGHCKITFSTSKSHLKSKILIPCFSNFLFEFILKENGFIFSIFIDLDLFSWTKLKTNKTLNKNLWLVKVPLISRLKIFDFQRTEHGTKANHFFSNWKIECNQNLRFSKNLIFNVVNFNYVNER